MLHGGDQSDNDETDAWADEIDLEDDNNNNNSNHKDDDVDIFQYLIDNNKKQHSMAYKNSNDDDDVNIYDKLFLHVQNEVIDSLETHFNTHNNINSEEIEEEEEMNEEEKEKELKRIEKQIKDSRERSLRLFKYMLSVEKDKKDENNCIGSPEKRLIQKIALNLKMTDWEDAI